MSADVREVRGQLGQFEQLIQRFEQTVEWRVDGARGSLRTPSRRCRLFPRRRLLAGDRRFVRDTGAKGPRYQRRCARRAGRSRPRGGSRREAMPHLRAQDLAADGWRRHAPRHCPLAWCRRGEHPDGGGIVGSDLRGAAWLGHVVFARARSRSHVRGIRPRARTGHRRERGSFVAVAGERLSGRTRAAGRRDSHGGPTP